MMAFDTTEAPPVILAGQVLQQSGSFTDASLDSVSVIGCELLFGFDGTKVAFVSAGSTWPGRRTIAGADAE